MYSYINGYIVEKGSDYIVSDVGGIGYMIYCSGNTLSKIQIDTKVKLYIHYHVAEDVNALYGFYTDAEREMFRKLISVSRVGRKIALGVLSVLTPDDISMAVVTENEKAFDNVPGMGRKTAQRVILELKEKIDMPQYSASVQGSENKDYEKSSAIEALIALGYDGLSAGRAVSAVTDSDYSTVEELIKKALAVISGRK